MCCRSVTNFKENKGDDLFNVNRFPPLVLKAWRELAIIVGTSTKFVLNYRKTHNLPVALLGMGKGAGAWITYASSALDIGGSLRHQGRASEF